VTGIAVLAFQGLAWQLMICPLQAEVEASTATAAFKSKRTAPAARGTILTEKAPKRQLIRLAPQS
jgi:hypothetical protein